MARSDRTAPTLLLLLLAAAVVLLVVSVNPGFAGANAATGPPPASASFASAEEEWEEEAGEWEVEDDEEEWEVGEEEAGEGGSNQEAAGEDGRKTAPESCPLYRVSARVVASGSGAVTLFVDYRLDEPTKATVEYWLKGAHGALQLKPLQRRMSRKGSLRGVERLSPREMSKVDAARTFVVDLEMAGMPAECERYCTRHLTARQRYGNRTVWSEPAATGADGY